MTIDKVDYNKEEFMLIGLDAFVNVENDKNIDWKEFFQLTEDENNDAANNNQITEDNLKEYQIWKQ